MGPSSKWPSGHTEARDWCTVTMSGSGKNLSTSNSQDLNSNPFSSGLCVLFKAEMKIYLEQSIQSTKIRVSRSEYEYPDYSLQCLPACCQGAGKWWQTSCPRPNLSSLFRNETQHQMLVSPFYCNLWPGTSLLSHEHIKASPGMNFRWCQTLGMIMIHDLVWKPILHTAHSEHC